MKHTTVIVAAGLVLAAAVPAVSARAQNAQSFVSGQGSDSNNCNRAAPCRTLAQALTLTNAGGEIIVLDRDDYGPLNIHKAISIVNVGEVGIIFETAGDAIAINAGPNDLVRLRGLSINGGGFGTNGIVFNTGKSLIVENCVIRQFVNDGIDFLPNATADILVSNTLVADNGGNGIFVAPPIGADIITGVFNRVQAYNNLNNGIALYGGTSTGTIKATVNDSVAAGNANVGFGAATLAGDASTTLMVLRSVSANNLYGLYAGNPGAIVLVAHSTVEGNANAWFADSGGVVQSYADNIIHGNTANETAPPTIALR